MGVRGRAALLGWFDHEDEPEMNEWQAREHVLELRGAIRVQLGLFHREHGELGFWGDGCLRIFTTCQQKRGHRRPRSRDAASRSSFPDATEMSSIALDLLATSEHR